MDKNSIEESSSGTVNNLIISNRKKSTTDTFSIASATIAKTDPALAHVHHLRPKSKYMAHKARVDSLNRLEQQSMLFELDNPFKGDKDPTINSGALSRYVQAMRHFPVCKYMTSKLLKQLVLVLNLLADL